MAAESVKAASPVDKYVGARVRLRRREIEMTQEALGAKLGITYQQIQKYENGSNRIGASRLHQIAAILGVPVPWFFYGAAKGLGDGDEDAFAEATVAGDEITQWLATEEARELIAGFSAIQDDRVRRAFAEMVKQVAKAGQDEESAPVDRSRGRPRMGGRRSKPATGSLNSR